MNLTALKMGEGFWDRFAPLYEIWVSRCLYHRPLLMDLTRMAEPGWNVLDIGAATGILSFPLAAMGCAVTAVEPSAGMREIFAGKPVLSGAGKIEIVPSTWEDYRHADSPDLVIACNSLHLTAGGITAGMEKVFATGASTICLITEINQDYFIDFRHIHAIQASHEFLSIKNYRVDSSYYFETMEEVLELEEVLNRSIHAVMLNDLPVWRDSAEIAIVWWEKKTPGK